MHYTDLCSWMIGRPRRLSFLAFFLAFTVARADDSPAPAPSPSSPPSLSLITNGDFEAGTDSWKKYIPPEFAALTCDFSTSQDNPHSGMKCAELTMSDVGRFCLGNLPIPVEPGDRYRVTVWIRATADSQPPPNSPGFSFRLIFRKTVNDNNLKWPGSFLQINPDSVVSFGNTQVLAKSIPTDWTKMEAVIEIPPGIFFACPDLILIYKGPLFVDDVTFVKVDPSTPLNPIVVTQ